MGKFPASMLGAFLVVTMITATSTPAFAEAYLFDLLAEPAYAKSWNALFLGESNVEPWLTGYSRTKNGPATPGKIVMLENARYQINSVCKTHSCSSNTFYVLFSANGQRAWGLLLTEDRDGGRNERFFGNPDEARKQVLRAAAN